ncbi:MAG TPA: type II secretion system F family protein [Acidimicrobiales bacterium]|nr:type II secretion system F family protein [Acidimicrobiales bacterium]
MTPIFVALGALAGLGIVTTAVGVTAATDSHASSPTRSRGRVLDGPPHVPVIAACAAIVALILTRWPVASVIAAYGVLTLRGLAGNPSREIIAKLEGLATWTEMLRDTLAGSAGISQAIKTTSRVAPSAIRAEVEAVALRLDSGVRPREAIGQLAEAMADPTGDRISAALIMATEARGQKLGELLTSLAVSTRAEVAMRLRVEASRSSARTQVRTVAGFSGAFFLILVVVARGFLAPMGTAAGQLVLAVVGGLFALGLHLMSSMTTPEQGDRFLCQAPQAASGAHA